MLGSERLCIPAAMADNRAKQSTDVPDTPIHCLLFYHLYSSDTEFIFTQWNQDEGLVVFIDLTKLLVLVAKRGATFRSRYESNRLPA
jgi:hypothetical protein